MPQAWWAINLYLFMRLSHEKEKREVEREREREFPTKGRKAKTCFRKWREGERFYLREGLWSFSSHFPKALYPWVTCRFNMGIFQLPVNFPRKTERTRNCLYQNQSFDLLFTVGAPELGEYPFNAHLTWFTLNNWLTAWYRLLSAAAPPGTCLLVTLDSSKICKLKLKNPN